MRAQKIFIKIFIGVVVIPFLGINFLFAKPEKAQALEWYESLISDGDFINANSMSLRQIQDFLISKGSYLAGYRMTWGPANRSGAEWIYYEAQEHGINPQVLMVTLQKEMSLITLSNPSQHHLDWAMGYGAYSGCAADGGWCTQYAGFGAQIHFAASWYRAKFDAGGVPSRHVGQTVSIQTDSGRAGYTNVYLSNRATAVLYIYTPYIYNGNYNFYNFYRNWFGGSPQDIVGIVQATGTPEVYLLKDGTKYHVDSPDTLTAWGYSFANVVNISQEVCNSIPSGNTLKQIVKNNSGQVYKIINGQRKWVLNQDAATKYSIDLSSASLLPQSVINIKPEGATIAYLIKGSGAPVYVVESGKKRHIINSESFYQWNFSWQDVINSEDLINSFSTGLIFSDLIKGSGAPVYMVDSGEKKHIMNQDIFDNWGFKWSELCILSDSLLNSLPSGKPLKRIAKGSGPEVYLIDQGLKKYVISPDIFENWGFRWEDLVVVTNNFLNHRSSGNTLKRIAKGASSPQVYLMDQNMRKHIPDSGTFNNWGFKWEDLAVVSEDFLRYYPFGNNLKKSARPVSLPNVYLIENGSKRWITNPNAFPGLGITWNDVLVTSNEFLRYYPEGSAIR